MPIQSQECSSDNHTTLGQSLKASQKVDTTNHMNVSDLPAKFENHTIPWTVTQCQYSHRSVVWTITQLLDSHSKQFMATALDAHLKFQH